MADAPTIGDLVKAKEIAAGDVDVLIVTYRANPSAGALPLGKGYKLDVAKAIKAHPPAAAAVADPVLKEGFKRTMIRIAIMLARPVKA